jgi:magnesium transporter
VLLAYRVLRGRETRDGEEPAWKMMSPANQSAGMQRAPAEPSNEELVRTPGGLEAGEERPVEASAESHMRAIVLVDGVAKRTSSFAEVSESYAAGATVWVDLEKRTPDAERLLTEVVGAHPLLVEDIWKDRVIPKIDDYDPRHLYVVVHGLRPESTTLKVELFVLDVLLGKSIVVTQHNGDAAWIEGVRDRVAREPRLLEGGPPRIAHALLDDVVDRFAPLIAAFEERIHRAEEYVVEKAGTPGGRDILPELYALKRGVAALSRIAEHQRATLERLSSSELREIGERTVPYFRDVYDHFSYVADRVETFRAAVADAMSAYLSVQSNRMNDTVKRLTLISTILLPLNLIAAIYGMNFTTIPELEWRYGYAYVIALMLGVSGSIFVVLKRKRWL